MFTNKNITNISNTDQEWDIEIIKEDILANTKANGTYYLFI